MIDARTMELLNSSAMSMVEAVNAYKAGDLEGAIGWAEGVPDEVGDAVDRMENELADAT